MVTNLFAIILFRFIKENSFLIKQLGIKINNNVRHTLINNNNNLNLDTVIQKLHFVLFMNIPSYNRTLLIRLNTLIFYFIIDELQIKLEQYDKLNLYIQNVNKCHQTNCKTLEEAAYMVCQKTNSPFSLISGAFIWEANFWKALHVSFHKQIIQKLFIQTIIL